MTRDDAGRYVYESYLRSLPYQNYDDPDAVKRHPEFSREIIRRHAHAPAIVVTGSKGKGSVARMTAAIIGRHRKVGLMTSPHLRRFNERFSIGGQDISDEDFVRSLSHVKPEFDEVEKGLSGSQFISPIGIETALALDWFAREKTEIDVLECGKGARYDDVNNVPHELAAINTVFLEHTRELGPTLSKIAADKAFVIEKGMRRVIVGPQPGEALTVLEERAADQHVPLSIYGRDFTAGNVRWSVQGLVFDVAVGDLSLRDVRVPVLGGFQARNAALAIALSREALGPSLEEQDIREALASVRIPARMEVVSDDPFILLDACINGVSCREVVDTLKHLGISKGLTTVIGIPDDKDFLGVAQAMAPLSAEIILTGSNNKHYVFTERSERVLSEHGITARFVTPCRQALAEASAAGRPTVILGTTSLVSEVVNLLDGWSTPRS